jgi:hypothetical protein
LRTPAHPTPNRDALAATTLAVAYFIEKGESLSANSRKPNGSAPADGKKIPRPDPATNRNGRRATSHPPASRQTRTSRPPRQQPRVNVSYPDITIKEAPVGRETLAAIEEELAGRAPSFREKLETVRYHERPRQPSSPTSLRASSPELITISEAPIGRATMDAIEEDLAREALAAALAPQPLRGPRPATSRIFEISVFVIEVECNELSVKSTDEVRRAFVKQRLLHRVPALSMDDVVRISVSPTMFANTLIVRVWSAVGPAG